MCMEVLITFLKHIINNIIRNTFNNNCDILWIQNVILIPVGMFYSKTVKQVRNTIIAPLSKNVLTKACFLNHYLKSIH